MALFGWLFPTIIKKGMTTGGAAPRARSLSPGDVGFLQVGLPQAPPLTGWLYSVTRWMATSLVCI